jgi:replicative DNA helicase
MDPRDNSRGGRRQDNKPRPGGGPNAPHEAPQNLEAEASLLGAILIDSDALVKIADNVSSTDFFDKRHEHIYEAILKLYERRSPIDVLTLADQLKIDGVLDLIGGASYLAELTNFVPTASHVEQYAEIVAQKALRRRLIATSQELTEISFDESKALKELIEEAESRLFQVSQKHVKQSIVSIESVLQENYQRLHDLYENKGALRGVTTGFRDMDNLLAGLQRSDLLILAARPAMGKTALSLNLAYNVAMIAKQPVLFFSLEMGKEQLVERMLAVESGVDAWALRNGKMSEDDFGKIGMAMGSLAEAPIFIDDTPGLTVSDLRTKARRESHKHQLGLIIVDYLQLMSGGSRFGSSDNRVQEISEISRGLKLIARELNVPLIALSQLSRSVESRSPQIPQLADLRESGSIEQDADIVMFIYREEYYNPDTDRKNITDVMIKKHRNGALGTVELYFDKDKQRFRSLDTRHATPFAD